MQGRQQREQPHGAARGVRKVDRYGHTALTELHGHSFRSSSDRYELHALQSGKAAYKLLREQLPRIWVTHPDAVQRISQVAGVLGNRRSVFAGRLARC
jgi:hypothetical protein